MHLSPAADPEFGFAHARELVPYLRDLGVSHLYLSPSLQARTGSTHGYDVVDPRASRAALGGEDEFRRLRAPRELGVILDIVPNHMAAVDENPFWRDLALRQMFFDVDLRTGFHRRFFDVGDLGRSAARGLGGLRATHAKVLELVGKGWSTDCVSIIPTVSLIPREYLERLRERRRRARVGREDPRAGRGAARLASRGDDGLRVPERGDGAVRRSAARSR